MNQEEYIGYFIKSAKNHMENDGWENETLLEIFRFEHLVYQSVNLLMKETIDLDDIRAILFNDDHLIEIPSYITFEELSKFRRYYEKYFHQSSLRKRATDYYRLKSEAEAGVRPQSEYPFLIRMENDFRGFRVKQSIHSEFEQERVELFDSFYTQSELYERTSKDLVFPEYDEDVKLTYKTSKNKDIDLHLGSNRGLAFTTTGQQLDDAIAEKQFPLKPETKTEIEPIDVTSEEFRRLLEEAAEMIDEIVQNKELPPHLARAFKEEQRNLNLIPTDELGKFLDFKKSFSIQSFMGKGKSTIMMLFLQWLVRKENKKCSILTRNTGETFEIILKLRAMGINAVPIIGRTNEKEHFRKFLENLQRSNDFYIYEDFRTIVLDLLRYTGGHCIALSVAEPDSLSIKERKPCIQMMRTQTDKRVSCPLALKCSVHNRDFDLVDADVWVGTSNAATLSDPIPFVDPYGRTYLELMAVFHDVIFADESDAMLNTYEEMLISESELAEDSLDLFEKVESGYFKLKQREDYPAVMYKEKDIATLRKGAENGRKAVELLFQLFHMNTDWIEKYDAQSIHSFTFLRNVYKNAMFKEMKIVEIEVVAKYFRDRIDNGIQRSKTKVFQDIFKIFDGLAEDEAEERDKHLVLDDIVKTLFDEYLSDLANEKQFTYDDMITGFDSNRPNTQRNTKYDFAAYFLFKILEHSYYEVVWKLEALETEHKVYFEDIKNNPRNRLRKAYSPFISRSLLMSDVQFIYRKPNDWRKKNGNLTVLESESIGRELFSMLSDIPFSYGVRNAAVVYMSATSYAPGSPHFGLDVPKQFILENKRVKKAKITQEKLKLTGQPFVSGEKDRIDALKRQLYEMRRHLEEELHRLAPEKRKVMLIVNSYDQAFESAKTLKTLNQNIKVKALAKVESDNDIDSEMEISSLNLHKLTPDTVDVFIVPLESINRGYNILKSDGKGGKESLFKTVYFLIRPLMFLEYAEIVKIMNASKPDLIDQVLRGGFTDGMALRNLQLYSKNYMKELIDSTDTWTSIAKRNPPLAEVIAWYVFINLFQMVGRALRGSEPSCKIVYVDSKFYSNHGKTTGQGFEKYSMLAYIESNLSKAKEKGGLVFEELYEPFYSSLKEMENDDIKMPIL